MGNPISLGADTRIHIFASSKSWIEDSAVRQLEHLAQRNGIVAVAGMPDLHPGHHGPVGCAAVADAIVHADVIGTDIGCGMQFWSLDMQERQINLDKLEKRITRLEGSWDGNAIAELGANGIAAADFSQALGTIGGGNHFCEVQVIDEVVDTDIAHATGLSRGQAALLVHSGSRGLGAAILQRHYHDGTAGLALAQAGMAYMADHDGALRFAKLNREVIAKRALEAIRSEGNLVVDQPHNMIEVQGHKVLHRKGAAASNRGLVPIAGSRGAYSYLVLPLEAPAEALQSLAHGAGRKHDRGSMERRLRTSPGVVQKLVRTKLGSRVICTDKRLLMEEAPEAYKDISRVIEDLESQRLARVVAIMRPLLTFKTAREARS
jgi:release factor H-coupled RctB family protein